MGHVDLMNGTNVAPRLFMSYSWTTEEHQQRVLRLAEQLVDTGVDVILDKWDLKDGNDTHAFMEIIADTKVNKVAMICDRRYVEKANNRIGGAGIEAQIITPGIYQKHDQNRYVAVVFERDEEGNALVPTYYGSRKYIDYTDPTQDAQSFEMLLRWAHDKPLYVKPSLGSRPAYLDENSVILPTAAAQRRAIDALKNHKPYAVAALTEYFDLFAKGVESFRIDHAQVQRSHIKDDRSRLFDTNIEMFLPYRNEFIELVCALALCMDNTTTRDLLCDFFERLIPYQNRPEGVNQWNPIDFDNFKFIIHEMFLYAVAAYLKHNRLEAVLAIMTREFYVAGDSRLVSSTSYEIFYQYLTTCEIKNQEVNPRKISPHGDLLVERNKGATIALQDLLAADFLLFLRMSMIEHEERANWYPVTLIYTYSTIGHNKAFPIFARATSKGAFEKIKGIFDVRDGDEFRAKLGVIAASGRGIDGSHFSRPDIKALANAQHIGTKP